MDRSGLVLAAVVLAGTTFAAQPFDTLRAALSEVEGQKAAAPKAPGTAMSRKARVSKSFIFILCKVSNRFVICHLSFVTGYFFVGHLR